MAGPTMQKVSTLVSKDISNYLINQQTWGGILFNVKAHGAKGDGTTDDSASIQSAIDAAETTGGIVFFPPGTYLMGTTLLIPSDVSLIGAGIGISTIKIKNASSPSGPDFGGTARIITNKDALISPFNSNITLENLSFDGNGTNQTVTTSIAFKDVTGLRVINCDFSSFGKVGVYNQGLVVFGGSNILVTGSTFAFCSGDGLAIAEDAQQAQITSNKFLSNTDYGVAVTNNCLDVTVTGNISISNGQNGIGVDECAGVTVTGNVCKTNARAGIEFLRFAPNLAFPNDYYTCTGNVCRSNATGIMIGSTTRINATGNVVSGSTDRGIMINETRDSNISNNDISNCTNEGIVLITFTAGAGNEVGDNQISGNRVEFCSFGIRELSSGGTVLSSSIFGNKVQNNTTPVSLSVSKFFNSRAADGGDVIIDTDGVINFDAALSATTATAGAQTLPANPAGFIIINVAGVGKKIPYYDF